MQKVNRSPGKFAKKERTNDAINGDKGTTRNRHADSSKPVVEYRRFPWRGAAPSAGSASFNCVQILRSGERHGPTIVHRADTTRKIVNAATQYALEEGIIPADTIIEWANEPPPLPDSPPPDTDSSPVGTVSGSDVSKSDIRPTNSSQEPPKLTPGEQMAVENYRRTLQDQQRFAVTDSDALRRSSDNMSCVQEPVLRKVATDPKVLTVYEFIKRRYNYEGDFGDFLRESVDFVCQEKGIQVRIGTDVL